MFCFVDTTTEYFLVVSEFNIIYIKGRSSVKYMVLVIIPSVVLCYPFSCINIETVMDLDSIHEELLGMPLLLRVWAEHQQQNEYENMLPEHRWEGR